MSISFDIIKIIIYTHINTYFYANFNASCIVKYSTFYIIFTTHNHYFIYNTIYFKTLIDNFHFVTTATIKTEIALKKSFLICVQATYKVLIKSRWMGQTNLNSGFALTIPSFLEDLCLTVYHFHS